VKTGGADHFLAFIEEELKPEISRRLPVDAGWQGIFGHSFGGLFVLHALFNRPEAFTDWIAISPAIWWEDSVVLKSAERFERHAGRVRARVLLAAGSYEQNPAPFQRDQADRAERIRRYGESRVEDNAKALAERLRALQGVNADFVLFDGETHMSVLPVAINRAIRFALGPDAAEARRQAAGSGERMRA
jgi:predicted alpha/beta superfamily hydrolase